MKNCSGYSEFIIHILIKGSLKKKKKKNQTCVLETLVWFGLEDEDGIKMKTLIYPWQLINRNISSGSIIE
jgi:hypothetical protein